jgi:hypothetical protein
LEKSRKELRIWLMQTDAGKGKEELQEEED